jgi:hypothetical protein
VSTACSAPGKNGAPCARPIYALGLCRGHYAAQLRGRPLVPLRDRTASAREVVSLRVSPECRERILAKPAAARLVLEHWARRAS